MENGNVASGLGNIQWWGFSPSLDLTEYSRSKNKSEVNILLVGASDIRHILHTLSKTSAEKVNFWIYEDQIEVLARQILLLLVMTEPDSAYGLNSKTSLYLDLFGNSLLRPASGKYLKQKSRVLSEMITDLKYAKRRAPFLNLERLKFKDRDRLDDQFVYWRQDTDTLNIREQWDIRLRQYLGARYDAQTGAFDWALSMQLYEKKATMITKTEYFRFREIGVAFSPFDEEHHEIPNKTISSSKVLKDKKGEKNAYRGYWGDITVGPFLCHGIETKNKDLLKTINKKPSTSSDHISQWNINNYFNNLHDRTKYDVEIDTSLVKRRELYQSHYIENTEICLLSPNSFDELADSAEFQNKFDLVFISTAQSQKLSDRQFVDNCVTNNGLILVETPNYILDLKSDQIIEARKAICKMAGDCNLQSVTDTFVTSVLTFQKS